MVRGESPWTAIERFEKAAEYFRLARDDLAANKMKAEAARLRPSDGSAADVGSAPAARGMTKEATHQAVINKATPRPSPNARTANNIA